MGWLRRGKVRDQGVDQPSSGPRNTDAVRYVESGELIYHLSHIEASKKEELKEDEQYQQLKFDADSLIGNKRLRRA